MKITEIFKKWPSNTIATAKWFSKIGISRQLLHSYCKLNLIERIDHGCYKKSGENIDWPGAIYAIQNQLDLFIHPSGYTSLDLLGIRHHLSVQNRKNIHLSGLPLTVPPRWLLKNDFGVDFVYKTSHIFNNQNFLIDKIFSKNYSIKISSLENSLFEILEDINDSNSFEDAANIIESIINFNEKNIQNVFKNCTSFKVKRIFLFLIKYFSKPIFTKISYTESDLGSGIFQIISNGKFDSEFKITVPKNFKQEGKNPF